jgi:hypothetical protein
MTNFERQVLSQLGRVAEKKIARIMREYGMYVALVEYDEGHFEICVDSVDLVVTRLFEDEPQRQIVDPGEYRDRLLAYLGKEHRG